MCGICGLIQSSPISDRDFLNIKKMNGFLIHRGPDSEGYYRGTNIALAMRRLKIIDLFGGDQPLYNEDSSIVLIANGEIYNYVELRNDLLRRGHQFKSRSDCETIIHLYEEMGENCVHQLRGMFAFALYDKKRKRLFIARDRLSEKPLYYFRDNSAVYFASEMKALLSYLRTKSVKIDHNSLNMYFHYQFVPEPFTCIEGVYKLPAAHYMTVELQNFSITVEKYWDFEDVQHIVEDPAELIRQSFDNLSRIIIRADVPVGIALSGGIDSGALAVFASKYYREQMHVFSVGYPGKPENDERDMAKDLADKIGLTYHDVELTTEGLIRSFPKLAYYMDDPIADIAAFGYYAVNKKAREHGVPVLLNGLAGDELFWGYEWVRNTVKKNMMKKKIHSENSKRKYLRHCISSALGDIGIRQAIRYPFGMIRHFVNSVKREKHKMIHNQNRYIFYDDVPDFISAFYDKSSLYTDDFSASVNDDMLYSFFDDKDWDQIPIKVCKFLFHTWLYSNCVALGDRMSMASSIECRLPFLDYQFVELVMGLRKTYKDDYKLGYKKWFIDSMKNIIPEEILTRKKRGFTPPVNQWYEAIVNNYKDLCYDGYLSTEGVMRKDKLMDFMKKASSGRGNLFFAYKIVLFEMWYRQVVMGNGNT